jgi:hypothetical protein
MIAKLSYGTGFYGVFAYAESKEEGMSVGENGLKKEPGFEKLSVNNFKDGNSFFSSKNQLANSLKNWSLSSRRVEKPVFHASLALPPGERLSNERINQLAVTYMQKMGYGNNPFVVYKHNDTHHSHVHIISSRIGEDGKVINPSYEYKINMRVCRELEKAFGLQEVSSQKTTKQVESEPHVSQSESYTKSISFKQNVLRNINFALQPSGIDTIEKLSNELAKKNIELVYSGPDGERLPKSGLIFYRKSTTGQRESKLKGWALGKGFGKNIELRLIANQKKRSDKIQKVELVTSNTVSTTIVSKLSFPDHLNLSKALFQTYSDLQQKVIYTEDDLVQAAAKNGLSINIKRNKSGFNGFSVLLNNQEYKPSDFSYNSIKLSSTFLKQNIKSAEKTYQEQLFSKTVELINNYKKAGHSSHLGLLNYLNRNGIFVTENQSQLVLSTSGHQKEPISVPLTKSFFSEQGIQMDNFEFSTFEKKEVLDFGQLKLYESLLSNSQSSLAKLSRQQIDFWLHPTENELHGGLSVFQPLVDLQNRIRLSSIPPAKGLTISFEDIIQGLNNRGIKLSFEVTGTKVTNAYFSDLISNTKLAQFDSIAPFNNSSWLQEKIKNLTALDQSRILLSQTSNPDKAKAFNAYEKTGIISTRDLNILLSDSKYTKDMIRLQKRYTTNEPSSSNKVKKTLHGHSKTARGDSGTQYGSVSNSTILNDLWENKRPGL